MSDVRFGEGEGCGGDGGCAEPCADCVCQPADPFAEEEVRDPFACGKCGYEFASGDRFCGRCGFSLHDEEEESIVERAIRLAGDIAPEQEHFITASLTSDDPERVASALQDLTAVEEGRSTDPLGYEEEDPLPVDDPAWCDDCGRDTAFCTCICHYCYELVENCTCESGGKELKCHSCGTSISAGDLFCGECGAAVSPYSGLS